MLRSSKAYHETRITSTYRLPASKFRLLRLCWSLFVWPSLPRMCYGALTYSQETPFETLSLDKQSNHRPSHNILILLKNFSFGFSNVNLTCRIIKLIRRYAGTCVWPAGSPADAVSSQDHSTHVSHWALGDCYELKWIELQHRGKHGFPHFELLKWDPNVRCGAREKLLSFVEIHFALSSFMQWSEILNFESWSSPHVRFMPLQRFEKRQYTNVPSPLFERKLSQKGSKSTFHLQLFNRWMHFSRRKEVLKIQIKYNCAVPVPSLEFYLQFLTLIKWMNDNVS